MSGEADEELTPESGPLSGPASRPAEQPEIPSARTSIASRQAEAEGCPECGSRRIGDDVFCEGCGYDFVNGAASAAIGAPTESWEAIVAADRAYFDRGEWDGIDFPDRFDALTIPLAGEELRIGRGELDGCWPELDLEDPAVSRFHALLVSQEDGSYAVVDQDSTNGTTMNDDSTPLKAAVPTPLEDGDRIHIGAWTTITLQRIGSRGRV